MCVCVLQVFSLSETDDDEDEDGGIRNSRLTGEQVSA